MRFALPLILCLAPTRFLLGADTDVADGWPLTRPERTDFTETSTSDDVKRFLDGLQSLGAPFTREVVGRSTQGRDLELVVVSDRPTTPEATRRAGKLVVYIQANIHGGEVEGKEAVQILLREIAQGRHADWLARSVLLTIPIYNPDGNDALGDARRLRSSQNGPAIVGQRPNGQGLDLNRDCIKAESPEMRAVLEHVYGRWDPDVVLDLHTTNGTRHGFRLTYSPPLDPNTPEPVLGYTRDHLLPDVRAALAAQGMQTFDYGNFAKDRWQTFGAEPRYVTNYAGTRGRIGVLSEATSYLPFRDRVDATHRFVREILDRLDPPTILARVRESDDRVIGWGLAPEQAPALGVRFEPTSRGRESIPLEDPEHRPASSSAPPGPLKTVEAEIFDRFSATRTASFPGAYFIPSAYPELIALLVRHGIRVERLEEPWEGTIDSFSIDDLGEGKDLYQGHRSKALAGSFERLEGIVPAGDYVVVTAQPLGVLAFALLEPESVDGAVAWGFLDRGLRVGGHYPVRKGVSRFVGVSTRVREVAR
ncbi:MAG: M14 family metallopeptidase [Planctomycetes bacterium]|nr:M14 family metallopeptidase [Planctomycetota bacterium]